MRRGDRLFEIIQVLGRASRPMTAEAIAAELETSKKTAIEGYPLAIAAPMPCDRPVTSALLP